MPAVLTESESAVLRLTLNRPERLNAVSEELYRGLIEALGRAAADRAVRVVVLRGAGRAFSAGADLKAHAGGARGPADRRAYAELAQEACRRIRLSPKPVVAQVHGYALGAGAELCLSADFLVVSEDAQIGLPELSLGTYVGGGITYTLPRLVGPARARRLLMLGERLSGSEARAWGLAHDAVPADALAEAAEALAAELAGLAPLPVRFLKAHLDAPHEGGYEGALRAEAEALLACMETEDWAEGVAAFAERRRPEFEGR